jgi:hypothetical protein
MAQQGWLHTIPPIRAPRHRHHHHHHIEPVEAVFKAIGYAILWMLILEFWILELEIWLAVWFYYGMFLGCRWIYRNNVLGQTVAALTGRRKPVRPAYDPHGTPTQPVDLAPLADAGDPWDTGTMRRRS